MQNPYLKKSLGSSIIRGILIFFIFFNLCLSVDVECTFKTIF